MPDPDVDTRLIEEVSGFADELSGLLTAVFPDLEVDFTALVSTGSSTLVIIEQAPPTGLTLCVDRKPLLALSTTYRCAWDHVGEYLAIEESTIGVALVGTEEPLFRYDFSRTSDGKVPGAHLNVHGHRDELVFALTQSGRRQRGKSRSYSMEKGKIPRLANLHLPLGGPRFRPSLEDVVEMVVREFGLDTTKDWQRAIRAGRARWREKQLSAAVRDDPETAAGVLRHLGYEVSWSGEEAPPARRDERVLAL